jgi:hypothetical protein
MTDPTPWTPPVAGEFVEVTERLLREREAWLPRSPKAAIRAFMERFGVSRAVAKNDLRQMRDPRPQFRTRVFESAKWRVFRNVDPDRPTIVHLSIRPLCGTARHDWRELQAIKNAILGPECEAVELYPAESRLLDEANQFHLWGSATPGERVPFGTLCRKVGDLPSAPGCVQRGRDGVTREMRQDGSIVEIDEPTPRDT